MKKIANLISLRIGIASTMCLSFIIYSPLRVSSSTAATRAATDLKSESQLRSEAARYDGAIRAISGIATMKLETGEDLKKALAILDRERPNLKFHFSKFVVLAFSDSTFTSAVKKSVPDEQAAEAFARELKADRKAVLKLNGAESLASRIQRSAAADGAVLRRAGERLREAAERIKKTSQGSTAPSVGAAGEFTMIRAVFSDAKQPTASLETLMMTPQGGPLEVILLVLTVAMFVTLIALLPVYALGIAPYFGAGTKEDQDQIAECQVKADDRYRSCVSEANDLPAGFPLFLREAVTALCYSDWLLNQAACLTLYV